jgi:hypothetical protein
MNVSFSVMMSSIELIGAHHTSCSAKIAAHSSQWPRGAAALALSRPVGEAQRRVAIPGSGDRADGFCE